MIRGGKETWARFFAASEDGAAGTYSESTRVDLKNYTWVGEAIKKGCFTRGVEAAACSHRRRPSHHITKRKNNLYLLAFFSLINISRWIPIYVMRVA